MKKKGLMVATIVMVLVLAISLTTATYAWFTETSTVTIDTIEFKISSGADMVIGLKSDNTVMSTAPTQANFYSGATTYTKGTTFAEQGNWTGDVNALASNIDLNGLSFSGLSKAIGTGTFTGSAGGSWSVSGSTATWTNGTNIGGTADTEWNNTNYLTGMIKANGQATAVDTSTIDTAWKNFDYLDVVIGVQATNAKLTSLTCYVTIDPTEGTIIGMNSAIHVAYSVTAPGSAEAALNDTDIYGDNHYASLPSAITNTVLTSANTAYKTAMGTDAQGMTAIGGSASTTLNSGAITVAIPVTTTAPVLTNIYQVHLVIFVAGYDSDCLEGAKGVASNIYVTFAGTKTK